MNVSYLEEEILKSNVTLEQCRNAYADDSQRLADAHPEGFCRVAFDSVLCWPPTPLTKPPPSSASRSCSTSSTMTHVSCFPFFEACVTAFWSQKMIYSLETNFIAILLNG
nr:unnamed protein product [Callosobruchus analis]